MKLMTKAAPAPYTPLAFAPEFDKLFDRLLTGGIFGTPVTTLESRWAPALDYSENEKEYLIRLEVPGIPKENLDVNIEGTVLTITGHREAQKEVEEEAFFLQEREVGRFVRTIRLPGAVLPDRIEAVVHDGVMTVRLPKANIAPRNKITIK